MAFHILSLLVLTPCLLVSLSIGWGGHAPSVTIEYDEKTGFLLFLTLTYNKRQAKKKYAFNARELKKKLSIELNEAGIFDSSYELSNVEEVMSDGEGRTDEALISDTTVEMEKE